MSSELHRMMQRDRRELLEADVSARVAIIRNTANDEGDDVFVTLPNSGAPNLRLPVNWRVGVQVVAGTLEARYPQEDDEGIVIDDETGDLWLIW